MCRYKGSFRRTPPGDPEPHGQGTFTSKLLKVTFQGLLNNGRPEKGYLTENGKQFLVTYAADCRHIKDWPDPKTKQTQNDVNGLCSDGKPHQWVSSQSLANDKTDRGGKVSVKVVGVGGGGLKGHSMHDHGDRGFLYCTKCRSQTVI